jgi:hypothetical protein
MRFRVKLLRVFWAAKLFDVYGFWCGFGSAIHAVHGLRTREKVNGRAKICRKHMQSCLNGNDRLPG